jgi:hypothetical protein
MLIAHLPLSELRLCVNRKRFIIIHRPEERWQKSLVPIYDKRCRANPKGDQQIQMIHPARSDHPNLRALMKIVVRDRNTHIDCACSAIKRGYSVSQHPAFKPRPLHEGFHEGPCLRPGTPPSKMVGADGTKGLSVWSKCIDTNQGYTNHIRKDLGRRYVSASAVQQACPHHLI